MTAAHPGLFFKSKVPKMGFCVFFHRGAAESISDQQAGGFVSESDGVHGEVRGVQADVPGRKLGSMVRINGLGLQLIIYTSKFDIFRL